VSYIPEDDVVTDQLEILLGRPRKTVRWTRDLLRPDTVAAALDGVRRVSFGLSVSPDHLLAATVMATVAKEHADLDVLVDMSQMTPVPDDRHQHRGVPPATAALAPGEHVGNGYELTGPQVLGPAELAGEFAKPPGRPVSSVDVPWEQWREQVR
jgi:uncharacterized protein YbjT (DUF2867 family)